MNANQQYSIGGLFFAASFEALRIRGLCRTAGGDRVTVNGSNILSFKLWFKRWHS